jgi:penicillin amidase
MRWTIELAGNEIGALISAQNATSVNEWMQRTEKFAVPALSMMAADTAGNIAVRFTGALPIRPDNGRGDMLRDGSSGESDWLGFWKPEEYPASLNPAQGYLAAANQQPTDYYADSRYFGADWPAPWRALRINQLLRERRTFTVDDMRRFQTDPRSVRAELFVPYLVAAGEGAPGQAGSALMRADADNAARSAALLREWSLEYSVDNQRAILFEYVMEELNTLLWDELDAAGDGSAGPRPTDLITATLLRDEGSAWWDLVGTVERERRDDILVQSLSHGYTKLVNDHGEAGARGWRWDRIRPANINHLLRLPQFSARGIPVRGGPATLNPFPASGDHGSSWRMVVEMAPQVRAWGIYPGGQSGNPFSQRYSDRIRRWSAGELDELRFPRSAADLGANAKATLTLRAR